MAKGSMLETVSNRNSTAWYYLMAAIAQIPALIGIILIGVLFGKFLGGYGWNQAQVFNYHPLFMALGLIFFYGDAILVYRVFRDSKKIYIKILHAAILVTSLILAAVGLQAVFQATSKAGKSATLISLHSWFGLTTVILFGLQWVCGFIAYLFPKLNEKLRKAYMPSHRFWGRTIFIFALITFMMGIAEYTIFHNLIGDASLLKQRNMLYVAGIMFLIFGFIVLYLVGDRDFERPAEDVPDEHVPLNE